MLKPPLFTLDSVNKTSVSVFVALLIVLGGCAKHSDFVEIRDEITALSKANAENQKRQEAIQRRLQALESAKPAAADVSPKTTDATQQRLQELMIRLSDLESRVAKVEDSRSSSTPAGKSDEAASQQARLPAQPEGGSSIQGVPSSPFVPGAPTITPTSAFNLAYNDYLNGRYELAVHGFQRFLKDFPTTSLAPNAHYWIGESYFSLKDFGHAMQAFQKVVNDYPRSEKVPPALFKLGLTATEIGDTPRARGYLKRIIEEFSTSDEAKLAKNKLAEIR